jgi:hypothetical protein
MDAYEKLMKAGFGKKRGSGSMQRAVLRVLLQCAAQEVTYNPYYEWVGLALLGGGGAGEGDPVACKEARYAAQSCFIQDVTEYGADASASSRKQ